MYHSAIDQTPAGDDGRVGVTRVVVDGSEQPGQSIPLLDDHQEHTVTVAVQAE